MKDSEKSEEITRAELYDDLEMSVLHRISRAIVRKRSVSELMRETLEILDSEMGLLRGTITMRDGDLLFIEASHGLDDESAKRGVYKIGEGVTGRVAAEGKSVVVEDISQSSEFLDRTKSRGKTLKGIAFVCVPIMYMEQAIGTLSIDRKLPKLADLRRDLELLETIANIISDSLATVYLRHEERNRLVDENRRLKIEIASASPRPKNMIGNCGAMQKIYGQIACYSATSSPVFIRGKSGCGKELCARSIFEKSQSHGASFKVVNCAAYPDTALLGEIFGYEKDSFARVHDAHPGLFETSEDSTIFFDEVADISLPAQARIAEFLASGRFRRINGKLWIESSPRLIFASCADIEKLLESKNFDSALYAAISSDTIHIPSLRDRKSDILLLAEHFLEKFNAAYHKNIKRISTPAINMMTIYSWPGNVRELENCIERAVMNSNDSTISGYNLTPSVRSGYVQKKLPHGEDVDFISMIESFERELITEALKSKRGNAAAAARSLNLTERIMNYKIKKYSITPSWYKGGR